MLHEQIRKARIAAGLTQSEVARLAGVQRRDLRKLEQGENVTLSTVRKVMAVIPTLKPGSLGIIDADPAIDLAELRAKAEEMICLGQSILTALGGSPVPTPPPPPAPIEDYTISPELRAKLEELHRDIERMKTPAGRES